MRRDVVQALADPTRREILNILAVKSLKVDAVADNFSISRPAVSRHIRILIECGLVQIKKDGREHVCEARMHRLQEVSRWIEPHRKSWTIKMDALGDFLSQQNKEQNP
jgi:DNA-binding transcriptional ArsR family regulator